MDVIIMMCLGIFVGNRVRRFSPRHFKAINEYLQIFIGSRRSYKTGL